MKRRVAEQFRNKWSTTWDVTIKQIKFKYYHIVRYWELCNYIYKNINKTMKNLFSIMSNLETHYHFKLDFQQMNQLIGGKWLIHDTKQREDNQLLSLQMDVIYFFNVPYRYFVALCNLKFSHSIHNDKIMYLTYRLYAFLRLIPLTRLGNGPTYPCVVDVGMLKPWISVGNFSAVVGIKIALSRQIIKYSLYIHGTEF